MSSDYTVEGRGENRRPIVYIFARDADGRRAKFKIPWEPYFYAPAREVLDDGKVFQAVDGVEVKRVDVSLPRDVPVEAKRYSRAYEDKLPFPLRMLIDKGIRHGFDIVGGRLVPDEDLGHIKMKVMYVDIEVELVMDESGKYPFPDPEIAPNMILTISYTTTDRTITKDPKVMDDDDIVVLQARNPAEEKEILQEFFTAVAMEDPDVITGWNVIGFDMTYIYNRAAKHKVDPHTMSPMHYVESHGKQKFKVLGRNVIDLDTLFRKFFQGRTFDSYKLDEIAALDEFVGWREEPFDYENHMKPEHLDKVIPYTKGDIKKLVLIDRELGLIDTFDGVRRVAGCRMEDIVYTSMYADIATLREFKGKYVLGTRGKEEREKYEGAYVHQPQKGVHENVVMVDFAGMYPNIIMSYNISPETWVVKPEDKAPVYTVPGVDKGYFRKDIEGIVPGMIRKFMDFRGKIKAEMKQYDYDSVEYQVLDKRQYGIKQMIAAVYGYFGFPGSRLYYPIIAKSITALGRDNIKAVINWVEAKGFEVIYGDTDSLMIRIGEMETVAKEPFGMMKEIGEDMEHEINEFLKEKAELEGQKYPAVIEFEIGYRNILFGLKRSGKEAAKKRYAGTILYYKGKPADTLVIKGFEAKRSDSAIVSRDVQKSTLDLILRGGSKAEVRKHVLEFVEILEDLPYEQSGIPKVIKKDFDLYEGNSKTALAPVLYANQHLGKEYGIGDRCMVFYIKRWPTEYPNTCDVFGKEREVNRVALDKDNFEEWKDFIDWEMQTVKVLENKLEPILDAFGLSFAEIITGTEQVSLEAFV